MYNKNENKTEFDEYAEEYASYIRDSLPPGIGDVNKFSRIKVWHICNEIKKRLCSFPEIEILDAGCGVGITDEYLKSHFPRITGLDISTKSLNLAKKRNPELKYIHYSGGDFPFSPNQFDVVFAICVVHHVPPNKWESFFCNIHRVLKPGGILIIFEHNPWNPLTRWIVSRCELDKDAVLISAPICKTQAQGVGFKNLQTKYILHAPIENESWSQLEDLIFSRVPFGAQYLVSAKK